MRISDESSDVCSSDLLATLQRKDCGHSRNGRGASGGLNIMAQISLTSRHKQLSPRELSAKHQHMFSSVIIANVLGRYIDIHRTLHWHASLVRTQDRTGVAWGTSLEGR